MKFGKLEDINGVDFSLRKAPSFNEVVFSSPSSSDEIPTVYIGCTGWSMKEWIGTIYPKGTKTKDYLHYYSRQFNTIEFNTTHYRTPSIANIEKWKTESSEDFRFCPKVLQTISHSRNLGKGTDQLFEFCDAIIGLDNKLGCCFMQLPPYFDVSRLGILAAFLDDFPSEIQLAVEVRHESWFQSSTHLQHLLELLHQHQVSAVITDVAGRRDVAHMGLSTKSTMIRFVGNNLHETDYSRIDTWIERMKDWFAQGLKEVYFFTHEPDNLLAPQLAVYLLSKIKAIPNIEVRGPKLLDSDKGEQMSLF